MIVFSDLKRLLHAAREGTTFFGLGMIALIWGGLAFHADDERQSATEDAVQHTGNLARAFEGHITQTIRGIDQTLLFLRASYQQRTKRGSLAT